MNEELKPAQELSEILQVRRDKLAALQAAGSDPFQITKFDVSHHSREVVENYASLEGKTVSIAGRISDDSPVGQGLIGHRAGETVTIHAPAGDLVFEILSVENN